MSDLKSQHFIFHFLLEQFKLKNLKDLHLLVGVSCGVDSMALLNILLEVKKLRELQISVVHVHHGMASDLKQKQFQNQAAQIVKDFCIQHQLTFYCNKNLNVPVNLAQSTEVNTLESNKIQKKSNEAKMREYRYQIFKKYMKESKADYLTLAHTAEDLLETRLIRLIRGTGEQGLEAMAFKRDKILRPFIEIHRPHIQDYVRKQKIKWCEDPSNQCVNYSFRNWIRHEWLPLLEQKRLGSIATLSRSLNLIVGQSHLEQKKIKNISQNLIKGKALRRNIISSFSIAEAQKIVAFYVKKQGLTNYGSSHIKELLKQMKRPQKQFRFFLIGKSWKVSFHWLFLEKDKNAVEINQKIQ